MSNASRIPPGIGDFNTYINNTDTFLQEISSGTTHNWERLGLSNDNADEWHSKRLYWRDTLYPKYTDPLQSTKAIKDEVRNFMEEFREFGQPQLNIMAASENATSDDELVFNFKIGRAAPVHHTEPIAETVAFSIKTLGGGDLRFTCRIASDSSRASIPDGADSVQLAYAIAGKETPANNQGDNEVPTPNDSNMRRELFTKAQFTFQTGAGNVGMRIIVFARWYNTKHPALAGPWSNITLSVIA